MKDRNGINIMIGDAVDTRYGVGGQVVALHEQFGLEVVRVKTPHEVFACHPLAITRNRTAKRHERDEADMLARVGHA